jgi:hypothetical protein
MTPIRPDDLDHLNSPHRWASPPVQPVKRPRKGVMWPELGIVVAGEPTVYFVNLFELQNGPLAPQLKGKKALKYRSFEEMLGDGWVVD